MKVLKYLFLVLTVVTVVSGFTPVASAAECTSVTYSNSGTSTAYLPSNPQCGPTSACPSYGGVDGTYPCSPTTATGLLAIINKIFTILFIFLITISSFALLYAAFLYVTSEGEEEKINTAKKIIIYAVVALIIAALAWGAPRAVQSFIAS